MKKRTAGPQVSKLASMAEEALQKAVREAIEDHGRTGDPVVIWRRGRVVRVSAKELLK